MSWDTSLLSEQKKAAAHSGQNAQLLAGPGTGKTLTLTRHICFLINSKGIAPKTVLALTFTRAAARELHQRVASELGEQSSPSVSTLHSFALKQLLKNSSSILALPQPLRIADDWEERNVVLEDLKTLLGLQRISDARDLLNQMSADWQSLTADEHNWDKRFPNPGFIGAWQEHRAIYGYTLRSELVYQLKKALEQRGDFKVESDIEHLIVDEYQDLNRCDLAVVQNIERRNVELFIAGDDDQSIYGFRKAHPDGIRRFTDDYAGASALELEVCMRCDRDILDLGLFVARQDPRRIDKRIRPAPGAADGEIALLRFDGQADEATGIATICHRLLTKEGLAPPDILILLRSDRNGSLSRPIRERLEQFGIPVAGSIGSQSPLVEKNERIFVAFLRLAISFSDSLAWRTLFQLWCTGIGRGAISAVYQVARSRGESFAETVTTARTDSDILPSRHRSRLTTAICQVCRVVAGMFPKTADHDYDTCDELVDDIRKAIESIVSDETTRISLVSSFEEMVESLGLLSMSELVHAIETSDMRIEQEIEDDKVNILTMHRAKGLTAEAVIVAAAEDQYVPGRAQGEQVDDERRLLYVSLTRAKHHLFITYCDRRTGPQRHSGRDSGSPIRFLTRFLTDCPHSPVDGAQFTRSLISSLKSETQLTT